MKRTLWLLGALALAGCGGEGTGDGLTQNNTYGQNQSQSIPSTKKAVEADPQVETRAVTIEATKLHFEALKADIDVPAAAVAATSTLTGQIPVDLKDKADLVPGTLMAFDGPTFAKPVELTIPRPKHKGTLVLVTRIDGKWTETDAKLDEKKNVYHLATTRLGTYAVLVKPKVKKGKTDPKMAKSDAEKAATPPKKNIIGMPMMNLPKH